MLQIPDKAAVVIYQDGIYVLVILVKINDPDVKVTETLAGIYQNSQHIRFRHCLCKGVSRIFSDCYYLPKDFSRFMSLKILGRCYAEV